MLQQPPIVPPLNLGSVPPPSPQPEPPPPTRKRNTKLIIGVVAAALVLMVAGGAITAALMSGRSGDPTVAKPLSAWDREQQNAANEPSLEDPVPTETTPAPGPTPEISQFTLEPKITDKQCFGSAGCSLTLKPEMTYDGPPLSEDDTWAVTYEIKGDESGPIIGTIEVTGTTYSTSEESLSTKSSKTKVTIKVTDLDKVGI